MVGQLVDLKELPLEVLVPPKEGALPTLSCCRCAKEVKNCPSVVSME